MKAMTAVRDLLGKLAEEETRLRETTFLAPCVSGGLVRARVSGLIYTFVPEPPDFEGWGVFGPIDAGRARLVQEAGLAQIDAYLALLPTFRLRLSGRLRHRTWLAYPANASDARQRTGAAKPVPVHLVDRGSAFEPILARYDGASWWFETDDRGADPRLGAYLREAIKQETPPEALRHDALTPEARMTYGLAFTRTRAHCIRHQQRRDEARLQEALAFAGGRLEDVEDRDDCWLVAWATQDGERRQTAVSKQDLTVLSAGICLDHRDTDFDLQSLVGVIEQRPKWM